MIETIQNSTCSFVRRGFEEPRKFKRLGLTLSKKGWTASVQWEGTSGARGEGKTQNEAIAEAILFAQREWGASIK